MALAVRTTCGSFLHRAKLQSSAPLVTSCLSVDVHGRFVFVLKLGSFGQHKPVDPGIEIWTIHQTRRKGQVTEALMSDQAPTLHCLFPPLKSRVESKRDAFKIRSRSLKSLHSAAVGQTALLHVHPRMHSTALAACGAATFVHTVLHT